VASQFALVAQLFLRSARIQRKRATLTIAAIAWGSLALLLLLSFGEGLKRQLGTASTGMGKNIAVLWPGETTLPWKGLPPGRSIRPRLEDIALLSDRVPGLAGIAGELRTWRASLTNGRKTITSRVTGANDSYGELRNQIPQAGGRFLNARDEEEKRRVIFLGNEVAKDLYGDEPPVGRTLLVGGLPYTVVGVLKKRLQAGSYGGPDAENAVIPITTFKSQFGGEFLENIVVCPTRPERMPELLGEIRRVLSAKYGFDPADERAVGAWDTVKSSSIMGKVTLGIQIFLGVIGGLTLMIGGVGVANIMYATVKERTREIGVQMALGARPAWIIGPLVLEGLLYTALGGLIGISAAVVLVTLIGLIPTDGNQAIEFLGKPTLSLPIGIASAAVLGAIGLLAGYFPARRAAAVDPARTLRYE